ncbi:MAG TPA: hypothetical protein VFQ75_00430, partial [Candidatus Limnocylindrales bacterium]|nr:hypothetical protein [Candidatus Limnocylindrales bacterium]
MTRDRQPPASVRGPSSTAAASSVPGWLAEIPSRRWVLPDLEARFVLQPGDRPLIEEGAAVTAGEA